MQKFIKITGKISYDYEKMDGLTQFEAFKFNQDKSRMDLERIMIKHNYLFNIVDHEFFEHFCKGLQPESRLVSRNTVSVGFRLASITNVL